MKNGLNVKAAPSKGDDYRTPYFCTRALVEHCPRLLEARYLVDPCPGPHDSISTAMKGRHPSRHPSVRGINGNALDFTYKGMTIITNPPYSIVDDIMECFFRTCDGWIALFLPIEFISVKRRRKYHNFLEKLIVFDLRMNLTEWRGGEVVDFGGVTYAWFVYDPQRKNGNQFETVLLPCQGRHFKKKKKSEFDFSPVFWWG